MIGRLKTAEEAKGILSRAVFKDLPKISKAKNWLLIIHKHLAARAGEHRDVRLLDPKSGTTYSWATKELPEPGKGTYAMMQPTHSAEYMGWEGTIPEGEYGAGTVKIERKEPVELRESNPDLARFNIYQGRVPEQFVLKRVDGKKWVIHNATPSRKTKKWAKLAPAGKEKYKEKKLEAINYADEDEVMQAKIDGSHSYLVYEKDKPLRLLSYRHAKSTPTSMLEHTYKPLTLQKYKVPASLHGSVLRGEIYAVDKRGKALRSSTIGGLLNANTWKSREEQKRKGYVMKVAPFNIERYKGRDVRNLPYRARYNLLKELVKKSPKDVELPPTAFNEPEKYKLIKKIVEGKLPETREGVVLWKKDKPIITKVKKHTDHDVWVREIYPSDVRKEWAGGFKYSLTPRGKKVGRVGTGFSHKMREDMLKNPSKLVGLVAKVRSQEMLPSGALRAPSYKGLHIEKGQ